MENLIITGKFMEIAGVTRNTLIHYDNIGLLKPVTTNERGDRFYHPFQLYHMNVIKLFQLAGMELKYIKLYFRDLKQNTLLDEFDDKMQFFYEQEKAILQEIHNYNKSYRFTRKLKYCMRLAMVTDPVGPPIVRRMKLKGFFNYTVLEKPSEFGTKRFYEETLEFIRSKVKHNRDGLFPIVSHLGKSQFENGENIVTGISYYTFDQHGSNVAAYTDTPVLLLRRIGEMSTIADGFDEIREYLNEHPEYELVDNVSVSNTFVSVGENGKGLSDRMYLAALKPRESEFKKIPLSSPKEQEIDQGVYEATLMASGQFIKRAGITRNMLNLYEKKKLFGPQLIMENGYKKYGPLQLYEVFVLKTLQQAGYSLDECKAILGMDLFDQKAYYRQIREMGSQNEKVKQKLNGLIISRNIIREIRKALMLLHKNQEENIYVFSFSRKMYYDAIFSSYGISVEEYNKHTRTVFDRSFNSDKHMVFPMGTIYDAEKKEFGLFNMFDKPKLSREEIEELDKNGCAISGQYCIRLNSMERIKFEKVFAENIASIEASGEYKVKGRIINMLLDVSYESNGNVKILAISLFPVVRV